VTVLLGWIDECIQAILPNRVYDLRDVGFNTLAAFMAILASLAVAWVRMKFGNPRTDMQKDQEV
jgi:VanZ family protein